MNSNITHQLANFARHLRKTKRLRASFVLAEFKKIPWHRIIIRGEKLFLAGNEEFALNDSKRFFILRALCLLDDLICDQGLTILKLHESRLDVNVCGVTLHLETWEDVYIVHEIFHCGEYEFALRNDCRVIDVGANIGVASLYFASNPFVVSIDSYELVPATASRFSDNLNLNPNLAAKITLYSHGLAKDQRTLEIDYYPDLKGSMGIEGIAERASQLNLLGRAKTRVQVSVKDAVSAFNQVVSQNPQLPVLAKIDCEGAEYEIIDALDSAGILEKIDVFVIEWHERGPDSIRKKLEKSGHFVILKSAARNHHGVMCSFRRSEIQAS